MKLKKPIVVLLLVCLIGVMFAFTACNDDDYRNERNCEPEAGEFYTLQKAYDNGWLSKGDLRNIAYHRTGDAQKKGFKPTPKNPEELSPETIQAIKDSWRTKYAGDDADGSDTIYWMYYYGVYDGMIAVYIKTGATVPCVMDEQIIAGIKFEYGDPVHEIYVWKQS